MASKVTTKKTKVEKEPKKLIEVFEDNQKEEYIPKLLVVELWARHPNNRNFDEKIGQVIWSDVAQDIFLESLRADYARVLTINLESNMIVGGPARNVDPREWVRTLYRADVATNVYAGEAREIFDAGDKVK